LSPDNFQRVYANQQCTGTSAAKRDKYMLSGRLLGLLLALIGLIVIALSAFVIYISTSLH